MWQDKKDIKKFAVIKHFIHTKHYQIYPTDGECETIMEVNRRTKYALVESNKEMKDPNNKFYQKLVDLF